MGALKQAHVGVALLNPDKKSTTKTRRRGDLSDLVEEEPSVVKFGDASIATPFTSKISSVRSVMSILSQGRCTLVTTLQMYKNSCRKLFGDGTYHVRIVSLRYQIG